MLQFYEPEKDYGTPASAELEPVTLSIDGVDVTVPAGTSVLRAAAEAGIKVPRLCATDSLAGLWLLPCLPGGNRGCEGLSRLLHYPGGSRYGGAHPDRASG